MIFVYLFLFCFVVFGIPSAIIFYFLDKRKEKKAKEKQLANQLPNPYIVAHEFHEVNRKLYDDYVAWCRTKGKIPMDYRPFVQDIDRKQKNYDELIKELYEV
ncbi:hypothetical protein ACQ1PF_07880 [Ornithobacterium rhinotracheale]